MCDVPNKEVPSAKRQGKFSVTRDFEHRKLKLRASFFVPFLVALNRRLWRVRNLHTLTL
jgi:hypothetical protein